ncbi:MAG: cytochrome C, partial [Mesorhizobium sp.]
MSLWRVLPSVVIFSVVAGFAASSQAELASGKFYEIVGGKVDARTYNG